MSQRGLRVATAALTVGLSAAIGLGAGHGVAHADRPPAVNPALRPAGDPAVPPDKTERPANSNCADIVTGGDGSTIPSAQRTLDLDRAWQFSQGEGQVIAVIDTGVARHPRLPDLEAAGDFVAAGGDGTEDCDGHGTFVAGIIAASRVDGQGFAGVAPRARIMTIRQTSKMYQKEGASRDKAPDAFPDGYGTLGTMASAIVRAVDRGATVINISEVWCGPEKNVDGPIGAALQYAVDRDVVVVVAAGNAEDSCKTENTVTDPLDPTADPWSKVRVNVVPARWDDYVLSVGSIDANGAPSKFTVAGPWLSVAAPGENMVSLDPRGTSTAVGAVNQRGEQSPMSGTSFATPIVSGVVALVRARFPELSAREVMKRIQATAHAPAEGWNKYIGYGSVDPIAALTEEVTGELPPKTPTPPKNQQLAVPAAKPAPDNTARDVALIGTGVIAAALLLGYLASFPIRRRFGVAEDND
ncbi:type VII secretion-associated serine protease mycosin [Nocardia bovistercoris]|uniref:Type VII secretion-associated serine protease mycosin n=1 Tax=Nocardia bovistercoris TaxID=2785916 RepID=A0A931I9X3_9NOCA|nr:type VII secretion-associated serine protease mycosin [Nocardia bovistercoris]MBH0777554.1 type VII secretion-associated serine protease mycosin [Nocardia bovistercoris]